MQLFYVGSRAFTISARSILRPLPGPCTFASRSVTRVLQCLLHKPQALPRFEAFAVLFAAPSKLDLVHV